MAPHFEDIRHFLASSSDFLGAMHMNLQADNAYLWHDEEGDLDVRGPGRKSCFRITR